MKYLLAMQFTHVPAIVRLLIVLSVAEVAQADTTPVVVFNSFGPGDTYKFATWAVSGASTPSGYRGQAEWFVPGISGTLNNVTLATYVYSGSGRLNFFIAEDSASGVPGSILESHLNQAINPNGLLSLNSSAQPQLQAGVRYWLCSEPADSTSVNGWFQNSLNYQPGFAFERSQWAWEFVGGNTPPSGVFRVSVVPVPEPTAAVLVLLAFLMMTLRRHRAVRRVSIIPCIQATRRRR